MTVLSSIEREIWVIMVGVATTGMTGLVLELFLTAVGLIKPFDKRPSSDAGLPILVFIVCGLLFLVIMIVYVTIKVTLVLAEAINPFPGPSWPMGISLWLWFAALCCVSTRQLRWVVSAVFLTVGGIAVLVVSRMSFALS